MTERQHKIALFLSSILLFIALFVLILFVIPKLSQLRELSNRVQDKKIEYQQGVSDIQSIASLTGLINQYKQQADALKVALPASSEAEDALSQLDAICRISNLAITSADVQSDEKGNLIVDLSTKGSYESTISLLGKLKDNLRPVKISSLSMTKADGEILSDFSLDFLYFSPNTNDNPQGDK